MTKVELLKNMVAELIGITSDHRIENELKESILVMLRSYIRYLEGKCEG